MPSFYKIQSPLSVPTDSTRFILNLNKYRNTHYRVLYKAKVNYKELMRREIEKLPVFTTPIMVKFVAFPKNKQLFDLENVCSIHSKFFLDALVEYGHLPDDNYLWVVETRSGFGGVDKVNPRVDIYIKPVIKE